MLDPKSPPIAKQVEPRWPAVLAILAVGGLQFILPQPLRFGPNWLLLVVTSALLIPTIISHRAGRHELNEVLGHTVLGILTASMVWSLALLIMRLPKHTETPQVLLRAAAALWVANVLVFATWYWRLDAGGPNERDRRDDHDEGAFLFPQMMLPDENHRQLDSGIRRLFFPGLQHQHRLLTHGYSRPFTLGETNDDRAVFDFVDNRSSHRRARSQHPLMR